MTDVRAGDRECTRQIDGAFPFPTREGRVREILQTTPRQTSPPQQECVGRLREKHDLQAQGKDTFYSRK